MSRRRSGPPGGRRQRRRPRARTWKSIRLLTAVGLVIVAAAVGAVAWLLLVYPDQRVEAPAGGEVELRLAETRDIDSLAEGLEAEGVVDSAQVFAAYLRLLGADQRIREASVVVRPGMTVRAVLRRIAWGFGPSHVRLTFPEGFTRFDIADRLDRYGVCSRQEFLSAARDPGLARRLGVAADGVEGYLFPDTYELEVGDKAEAVIGRMVRAFEDKAGRLFQQHSEGLRALTDLGFDRHQVVSLASIVEKEAVVAGEQATIAGVFLNRLRSETFLPRHRLQADPTVSYGCRVNPASSSACLGFDGRHITRAMLGDSQNPYNSYRHAGLPPTPISNPGLGAIRAVLSPARHDYLYFVARGEGRHRFSATLEEHNRAVRSYRGEQ